MRALPCVRGSSSEGSGDARDPVVHAARRARHERDADQAVVGIVAHDFVAQAAQHLGQARHRRAHARVELRGRAAEGDALRERDPQASRLTPRRLRVGLAAVAAGGGGRRGARR